MTSWERTGISSVDDEQRQLNDDRWVGYEGLWKAMRPATMERLLQGSELHGFSIKLCSGRSLVRKLASALAGC